MSVDSKPETPLRVPLRILLIAAILISVGVFLYTLRVPIMEQHGFRQTQTAISVYWMLNGGPWLDYWTPVLGAPWAIPFEFPLFQWQVALLVMATGIELDIAGRMISYVWLLLGLWPALYLFRSYKLPPATGKIYAILLLVSPVYLFWGRSFLIETQALSLAIAMIALMRAWFVSRRAVILLLACAAGIAAALTKITTILPFLLIGLVLTLDQAWEERTRLGRVVATFAGAAFTVMPGMVIALLWNRHADELKALNPLAQFLLSSNLMSWNFGTLEQRFSVDLMHSIARASFDAWGWLSGLIGLGLAVAWAFWRPADQRVVACMLLLAVAWLLPFLVFTNLYIIHNYYQAANAALLIAALAVAMGALAPRLEPRLLFLLLALVMASQLTRFTTSFAPSIARPAGQWGYEIGRYVRDATRPGTALVVAGYDWSSEIPYFAQRRSLMLTNWESEPQEAAMRDISRHLGGLSLGAVVVCPSPLVQDPVVAGQLAAMHQGFMLRKISGCDVFTAPSEKQTSAAG